MNIFHNGKGTGERYQFCCLELLAVIALYQHMKAADASTICAMHVSV